MTTNSLDYYDEVNVIMFLRLRAIEHKVILALLFNKYYNNV